MNYPQTLEYLTARLPMYHRIGAQAYKANLDNTIALCNILDNPQRFFKSVHIAGTNGKGSVSHMLASILQTAGYRTGLYTSPHLKDFRERIRVNGRKISKSYVTSFIEKNREEFETIGPSFFEMTVGLAFRYFRDQQVEVAVIETGLGGRLDSTNIINPLLSVITNVSHDHMQFLGDTLVQIASEKAGIIKPGIPVVIGESQEESRPVFLEKAAACHAEILFADQRYTAGKFEIKGRPEGKRSLDIFRDGELFIRNLVSPLAGNYQQKNILVVMEVCEQINRLGYRLSTSDIREGISGVVKKTGFAGRWQVLGRNPLTICDTGHNEGGLREVLSQISSTPHKRLHFVFGVVNDKKLEPILRMMPQDAIYYFCKPDIPRGLEADELQQSARSAGLSGACFLSVKAALAAARQRAGNDDLVFVGGSTFVVAEVV